MRRHLHAERHLRGVAESGLGLSSLAPSTSHSVFCCFFPHSQRSYPPPPHIYPDLSSVSTLHRSTMVTAAGVCLPCYLSNENTFFFP